MIILANFLVLTANIVLTKNLTQYFEVLLKSSGQEFKMSG